VTLQSNRVDNIPFSLRGYANGTMFAMAVLLALAMRPLAMAEEGIPAPRPLGQELPVYRASDEAATDGESVELGAPLTLATALGVALERHPALAAVAWEVRAREALALQAGLPPNPALGVDVEHFGGAGDRRRFDGSETTISLSQLVELGGKRTRRRRLGALDRDLAGWDFEARRLDVFADVTKGFVTVLALQARRTLADDLVRLSTAAVETVAATVRAGAVSSVEEGRARVAAARAEADRVEVERELDAARADLAVAIGIPSAVVPDVAGELTSVAQPPPLAGLLDASVETPEIARWETELEQRQAALALEESRRIPDVAIGPGVRRYGDDGSTALVLGFSVPLPVVNRNQGSIAAARARVNQANAERRLAASRIVGGVRAAHARLLSAFQRVRSFRDGVVPQARTVYEDALSAYRRGLFRYIEVLDAQRTYFEVRGQYLDALASYHRAATDVERLSGAPLGEAHVKEKGAGR